MLLLLLIRGLHFDSFNLFYCNCKMHKPFSVQRLLYAKHYIIKIIVVAWVVVWRKKNTFFERISFIKENNGSHGNSNRTYHHIFFLNHKKTRSKYLVLNMKGRIFSSQFNCHHSSTFFQFCACRKNKEKLQLKLYYVNAYELK